MNIDDNDIIDKAEQYIQGGMSENETAEFENKLRTDSSLYELVEKQKAIHSILIEAGLADIRQLLKNDLSPTPAPTIGKWIGGGIVIAALIGTGLYYLNQNDKQSSSTNKIEPTPSFTEKIISEITLNSKESITQQKNSQTTKNNKETISSIDKKSEIISTDAPILSVPIVAEKTIEPIQEKTIQPQLPDAKIAKIVENPCLKFLPSYSIKTIPSIVHQETGKIIVMTKETNLKFSIDNNNTSFATNFENLGTGKYTLTIENSIGCKTQESNILVGKTYCLLLEKETFTLSGDNSYQLPNDSREPVEIRIYDKKMQEIKVLKIGDTPEWDGRNSNGQLVETGLYKIELRHSNGERCLFNLTVFN